MRNIVGQPVKGKDFFLRPKEILEIWNALDSGSNILISASRRRGKTSILHHLLDNPKEDYHLIYINTEASFNEDEYFKQLYSDIIQNLLINKREMTPFFSKFYKKKFGITEELDIRFTNFKLKINQIPSFNCKEELLELLRKFQNKKRLVIMVDEFSLPVLNISKNEGEKKAVQFLQSNRYLRSQLTNVQFLYAASISLESLAIKLNASFCLNDLYSLSIPPLTIKESERFLEILLKDSTFKMNSEQVRYLFKKIGWLIPFYIQLFVSELHRISINKDLTEITTSTIDKAIDQMLKHHIPFFYHWRERLQLYFNQQEYNFVKTLLDVLSQQSMISPDEIKSIAKPHGVQEQYWRIIQILEHEDYINYNDKKGIYCFNSPLLKAWWYEQVAQKTGKVLVEEKKEVRKGFKNFKIQELKIRHIKCFEDVEINFDPSGNTGLIIGTNGKGKSTILQLIGLGLGGISNVPFQYSWKEVVKKNNDRGSFEIDGLYDNDPIHLKFEIDGKDDSITCTEGSNQLKSLQNTFMLLAYGVNRSYKLEEAKPYKDIEPIATLFGENGYLKHIKISSTYEYVKQNFETIQVLVNKVLEKANGDDQVILTHYDSTSFYFKTPSNPEDAIPIEALSEGFKSTLVWLFDAIIRIVERGGSLENAADVTGIILLDEIDLHLHPSWQRTILESVETLFPNIQFIVTSHSPFVVQSAKKECLIALETEKDSGNVVVVDKDITSELSYSAIVDEIFNISFPFSREIEQKMDKFREMANALRDNKPIDEKKFKKLVLEIASKGVELEGIMRRELMTLKRRTGKTFDL